MRAYSTSSEETLRARKLLKEWVGEGFLSQEQYQHLEQETVSEVRTTNIFLRLVLLLFSLIIVGGAVALFFVVFFSHPSEQTVGVFLLIGAALCYAAAEVAVSQFRFYRYGIEEALVICSVGFLCVGIEAAFFSGHYSPAPDRAQCLIPAAGAFFSFWIWRRFGLWYAFPAAMIFAVFLPGYWTISHSVQHVMVAAGYSIGLMVIGAIRSRHRDDYLKDTYSLAEAFLWLGIYLAINLKLSSLDLPVQRWWVGHGGTLSQFGRPFYWSTWALIWCVPAVVLVRGLRLKDRYVIAVGAIVAILTLISNKPYLGWQRRTWDPMFLGILLAGVALLTRRWLARGPGGIRDGFIAARLSGKDKHWMNASSSVLGLVSPQSVTPSSPATPEFRFGGGSSGGGGASSDF
ncbi:MAG TPA: hypothetical protein VMU05_14035 [Dongiaceae bacterium]|nr:hypothetical protein [Dongiaceae bacterium]